MTAKLAAALTATVLVGGLALLGAVCLLLGVVLMAWLREWLIVGAVVLATVGLVALWRSAYRDALARQRAGPRA